MAYKPETVPGESGFYQMETQVQYENGEKQPVILEEYLLAITVREAKRAILVMGLLKEEGHVRPEDIAMCLIMPGKNVGEASTTLVLDESKHLNEYLDDISCCEMIRLKRIKD